MCCSNISGGEGTSYVLHIPTRIAFLYFDSIKSFTLFGFPLQEQEHLGLFYIQTHGHVL